MNAAICAGCSQPMRAVISGHVFKYCSRLCANRNIKVIKPLADRFWTKVRKSDGCWTWTAARQRFGYGRIGDDRAKGGWAAAHRISWEMANGPIPLGLHVCHKCDNPPCVRPDHLFLGDDFDNMRDSLQKRRHWKFTHAPEGRPGMAKLTAEQVRSIRARPRRRHVIADLAAEFGVGPKTISAVRGRIIWRDIP